VSDAADSLARLQRGPWAESATLLPPTDAPILDRSDERGSSARRREPERPSSRGDRIAGAFAARLAPRLFHHESGPSRRRALAEGRVRWFTRHGGPI